MDIKQENNRKTCQFRPFELKLELIQTHMAQKPVMRVEACARENARAVSVERGGMGDWTLMHIKI